MYLNQITNEQKLIIQEIEALEGEITPEIEERLSINAFNLETKSMAYLEVINRQEVYNTLIDDEIKRLQALKKRSSTIIDKLRENLLNAVLTFGAFEIGLRKFNFKTTSFVEVADENLLPEEYRVKKLVITPDKIAIKKALKNGEVVAGAELLERNHLTIL